jgi:uncharacterized protein YijF (DUF1287 family)
MTRRLLVAALLLLAHDAGADDGDAARVVAAARAQVGVTLGYDGSYRRLDYPMGDVPIETGVCTDVVVRALRAIGIDLQREVSEDRRRDPAPYARHGRSARADRNIDHRRVPNLRLWFARHAESLPLDASPPAAFVAGDIVTWKLPGNLDHIGIVSDRSAHGRPLVLHNIGRGAREEDVFTAWPIDGHYRLRR